jgi:hypothetical protein
MKRSCFRFQPHHKNLCQHRTTFGSKTAQQRRCYGTPVPPKKCDRQHNISAVGLLRFQPDDEVMRGFYAFTQRALRSDGPVGAFRQLLEGGGGLEVLNVCSEEAPVLPGSSRRQLLSDHPVCASCHSFGTYLKVPHAGAILIGESRGRMMAARLGRVLWWLVLGRP